MAGGGMFRLSFWRLAFLLFLLVFVLAAVKFHLSLSSQEIETNPADPDLRLGDSGDPSADLARKTLGLADFTHLSGPELRKRIEELLRIKRSVQTELRDLERKRKEMQVKIH